MNTPAVSGDFRKALVGSLAFAVIEIAVLCSIIGWKATLAVHIVCFIAFALLMIRAADPCGDDETA